MPAGAQTTIAEWLYGPVNISGAQVTIAEVNNLTAPSPEKFKVWDQDKGQWVHAPRYVWDGSAWQPVS